MIIGGGGLLYDNGTEHFNYFTQYIQDKPFGFISCGIQIKGEPDDQHKPWLALEQLKRWVPYFKKAKFITVRSPQCQQTIQELTENPNVFYYPDLGYLTPACNYLSLPPNKSIIIPTPGGSERDLFVETFNHWKTENPDDIYFLCFATEDREIIQKLRSEFTDNENERAKIIISPEEAVAVLKSAKRVLACRYHGYIFARAAGLSKEQIVFTDGRYKAIVENYDQDITEATKHFDVVRKFID